MGKNDGKNTNARVIRGPEDVKALLARHGFRFSKSMGQNFLIDPAVPERIADSCGADGNTGVLEVGPGIGALTARLAERAAKVVSVELDGRLMPLLDETLSDYDNIEIVRGDILAADIPAIVNEKFGGLRPVACANLPYNITTPAITALIETGVFTDITVMIQREVARRLCAGAGTPDYGAFTLYVNYFTEPELLFDVFPESFMPQPKVVSSVVRMKKRERPPVDADEKRFFRVVRAAFAQRRKTLVNSLSSALGIAKDRVTSAVETCGLDPLVRGEALDMDAFARLAGALEEDLK
ncbi:MAG: 16S rRNA (adenine(1518)-N(6)/adenine(1519)-N(6))-dimethyltransferase RsmA [Oscillospiraceae bacterium]|nr:16S rRNA (adenine(1518)-N(6)/adenine(1519)-N(6))-dimethyltransferase RsmA [Oscillospiraceae bacterium]